MKTLIRWKYDERLQVARAYVTESLNGLNNNAALTHAMQVLSEDRRRNLVSEKGYSCGGTILQTIQNEIETVCKERNIDVMGSVVSANEIRRAAGLLSKQNRYSNVRHIHMTPEPVVQPVPQQIKNDAAEILGNNEVQVLLKIFDPLLTILAKKIANEIKGTAAANDPAPIPEQIPQQVGATFNRFEELVGSEENRAKYVRALNDAGVDTSSLSPAANVEQPSVEQQAEEKHYEEAQVCEVEEKQNNEQLSDTSLVEALKQFKQEEQPVVELVVETKPHPKPAVPLKPKQERDASKPDVLIVGLIPQQTKFVMDMFSSVANVRLEQTYSPGLLRVIEKSDLVMALAKACSEHTIKILKDHAKLFYRCENIASMKEKLQVLIDGE